MKQKHDLAHYIELDGEGTLISYRKSVVVINAPDEIRKHSIVSIGSMNVWIHVFATTVVAKTKAQAISVAKKRWAQWIAVVHVWPSTFG